MVTRDYYSEMKRLSNMLMTFAAADEIDIMLGFVPKFVEIQNYLVENHDLLVNDDDYEKTNSQLATLITYIAEQVENHTEQTYPKGSEDYKKYMNLAYEAAIQSNLKYLSERDASLRQFCINRIKCKAFDLYEKELDLQIAVPDKIIEGYQFEVTYSYNQEGKNFKITESPFVKRYSGPIRSMTYSPTFRATAKYSFICHQDGVFEIPRASIEIDGKKIYFPVKEIEVLPRTNSEGVSKKFNKDAFIDKHKTPLERTLEQKPTPYLEEAFQKFEKMNKGRWSQTNSTPLTVSEVQFQAVSEKTSLLAKYVKLPKWAKALIKLPILVLVLLLGNFFLINGDGSISYVAYVLWMLAIIYSAIAIFKDWEGLQECAGWSLIPVIFGVLFSIIFFPKCRIIRDANEYSKRMYMTTDLVCDGKHYNLEVNKDYILNLTGRPLFMSYIKYSHSSYGVDANTQPPKEIYVGSIVEDPGVDGFFHAPPKSIQVKGHVGSTTRIYLDYNPY